jgi:hypothetical protein
VGSAHAYFAVTPSRWIFAKYPVCFWFSFKSGSEDVLEENKPFIIPLSGIFGNVSFMLSIMPSPIDLPMFLNMSEIDLPIPWFAMTSIDLPIKFLDSDPISLNLS